MSGVYDLNLETINCPNLSSESELDTTPTKQNVKQNGSSSDESCASESGVSSAYVTAPIDYGDGNVMHCSPLASIPQGRELILPKIGRPSDQQHHYMHQPASPIVTPTHIAACQFQPIAISLPATQAEGHGRQEIGSDFAAMVDVFAKTFKEMGDNVSQGIICENSLKNCTKYADNTSISLVEDSTNNTTTTSTSTSSSSSSSVTGDGTSSVNGRIAPVVVATDGTSECTHTTTSIPSHPPPGRPAGIFQRLRLFSLSQDRPKNHHDGTHHSAFSFGSLPAGGDIQNNWHVSLVSPDEVNPTHLPKTIKLLSTRLAFTEKSILSPRSGRKHQHSRLQEKFAEHHKPRIRWFSGLYHSDDFNPTQSPSTSVECPADFARSAPDKEQISCFGLMEELIGAVNIIAARQNHWCSSGEARSSIQVRKAAQSSTLLFVRKAVDEEEDDVFQPKGLHNFDEENACSVFFRHTTCYDVLPQSGKLLIFDSTLPIRRAMQGLVDHCLEAAPVWSSTFQRYTHLLTQGLCLRLLAQVFPLNTTNINQVKDESEMLVDAAKTPPTRLDPAADMTYWEGKTLGRVLKTYFNWARSELPSASSDALQIIESPVVVTPQDHLHYVTKLLTLSSSKVTGIATVSATTPSPNRFTQSVGPANDVFYTPQNSPLPSSSLLTSSFVNGTDHSEPIKQIVPPPRHVLIVDKLGSGNLLGITNADRLMAYLRVRMRNLPSPVFLKLTVSELPGIRWEERGWRKSESPSGSQWASVGNRSSSSSLSPSRFYLHPSTTCHQALHVMTTAWKCAGLTCLPVASDTGRGFQGMLTKIDIMSTLFSSPLEVALSAPIGAIMALRHRPPGCTNQALCFTTDCLFTVLDHIFRQKASCLAVFEKPGPGASWNGQGVMGPAVGVVTTSDILHAIVLGFDTSSDEDGDVTPPTSCFSHSSDVLSGAVGHALSVNTTATPSVTGLHSSNSSCSCSPVVVVAGSGAVGMTVPSCSVVHMQRRVPQSPAASAAAARGHRNSLPLPQLRAIPKRPVAFDATSEMLRSPRHVLSPHISSPLGPNPITRLFHRQKRASESEAVASPGGLEGPFATHQRTPNTRTPAQQSKQQQQQHSPNKKFTEEDNTMFTMDFL